MQKLSEATGVPPELIKKYDWAESINRIFSEAGWDVRDVSCDVGIGDHLAFSVPQ